MLRRSHSLPGLVLGLALAVTAATGAALSVVPALDHLSSPAISRAGSVAELAAAVAARHETVATLRVRPTGIVTASYTDGETSGVERIDPATGAGLGAYAPSPTVRVLTDLHRAFGLGSEGRVAAALSAAAMLVVVVSGLALLARRLGGWSALLRPIRGDRTQRLHGELARLAALGLVVSSLTGLWMSASTFGLLPEAAGVETATASGGAALPLDRLAGLAAIDVASLRELTFADPADPTAVLRVRTAAGEAAIDPATGRVIANAPAGLLDRIDGVVRMLHTGRGAAAFGLVLGLSAATVPLLGLTGGLLWWRRRTPRVAGLATVAVEAADTVILVGSDGGSTRGFADTLARALIATGHAVHVADMNAVADAHLAADRLLILTATWGDGAAPASANRFLDRLATLDARPPVAVLGFGDRTFPDFCGHARAVTAALAAKGFPFLLETKRIDRRSAQEFAQWGRELGRVLGHDLVLEHVADRPVTTDLELIEREDYGAAVEAPVAILRFAAARDAHGRSGRLPAFEAGDLLGVVHPDAAIPRFYSLASSTRDGFVEICVRRMPDGLVSGALHALAPGDRIAAFVRENPAFRPDETASSLILIGAGAGLGPLAGFVRESDGSRPVHLYWGGRNPASDFLYEDELARALAEKRLTSLTTAFSRDPRAGAYVQDRIAADEQALRERIRHGAQILVCGSRDMGRAVATTLDRIVRPLGLDLATLRAGGRYVEDVY
jgi:sulfite reductase (NADPH) flavoprotein alpha-component